LSYAYRISRSGRDPLSSAGSRLASGRWHEKGTPVIYTAGTKSLAMLEILVHLEVSQLPRGHACHKIWIPDGFIAEVKALPADWREPESESARRLGTEWVTACRSAALGVPSVIVPRERNYILNSNHFQFELIHVLDSWKVEFDPRLIKTPSQPSPHAIGESIVHLIKKMMGLR
jgi:RES domain-containing protein